MNPLHAFYSNSRIREMEQLIVDQKSQEHETFKATGSHWTSKTSKEVRDIRIAKNVTNMAIHPDTGKILPWAMRFPSYILINVPVSFGMLLSASTPFNAALW